MALFAFIAFLLVANLILVFTVFGTCRPLGKLWNPTIPGTCFWPGEAPGYTQGGISSTSLCQTSSKFTDASNLSHFINL